MLPAEPDRSLKHIRGGIDRVDDAFVLLLALRQRLVRAAMLDKDAAGQPRRDPGRELAVRDRARRLGALLDLDAPAVDLLMAGVVASAQRAQGLVADADQYAGGAGDAMIAPMSPTLNELRQSDLDRRWAWLPPPKRVAPLFKLLPQALQQRVLDAVVGRVLATPVASGSLDFMQDRRLGLEVSDLGLRWVFVLRDGRVHAEDGAADATVRGTATDLLLLASRLEDADTLFFQRRLVLTGDTELGLTARNLLDRLDWADVPLGLRVVLNHGARIAQSARRSYRERHPVAALQPKN
ncbi:MAG: SCP2 sterol-binding domain-containing protein [Xanthomonadales bacterium]|nr:SCP2 sterol-binding domain-containing protein [Xanthomonadales bacterium]